MAKRARVLDPNFLEFVADLRGLVWASSGRGKVGWGTLAGKSRLCFATVSKFADGTTQVPHSNTVYMLASAVGYRMAFVDSAGQLLKPGSQASEAGEAKRVMATKRRARKRSRRAKC